MGLLLILACFGCVENRIKKFDALLNPLLGHAQKKQVSEALGNPVKCRLDQSGETCEYRSAAGRNDSVPAVHRKEPGFGPDVSPYDAYDPIQVQFDAVGVMKDWKPLSNY